MDLCSVGDEEDEDQKKDERDERKVYDTDVKLCCSWGQDTLHDAAKQAFVQLLLLFLFFLHKRKINIFRLFKY